MEFIAEASLTRWPISWQAGRDPDPGVARETEMGGAS